MLGLPNGRKSTKTEFDAVLHSPLKVLVLNLIQFTMALLAASLTPLMWHSFYIHTGFGLFLVGSAIWQGSSSYLYMLAPYVAAKEHEIEKAKRKGE